MSTIYRVGDIFADRFEIETIVSQTALGTLVQAKETSDQGHALLDILNIVCNDERLDEIRQLASRLRNIHHKSIIDLKDFDIYNDTYYVEMEAFQGETLESHLRERRNRGQILGLKVAYSFLAHICLGLEVLHENGFHYGSLSPRSVFVTSQGRIRVENYLCAWIADNALDAENRLAYLQSPFIAPEVQKNEKPTPQSDVYSLAVLMAELLSSVSIDDFKEGPIEAFISRIPGVSSAVRDALIRGTQDDPAARFSSLQEFKDVLKTAVDAPADNDLSSIVVGVNDLRALMPSGDMPALDLDATPKQRKPDLFDKCSSGARPRVTRSDVWIYVKNGIDFGPFDHKGIIKRFYDDEIDEATGIYNTQTKVRTNLGSVEEFKHEIQEYLPIRAQNRKIKADQERKRKQITRGATAGGTVIVLLIAAAVLVLPVIYLALLPEPSPIKLSDAFVAFDKTFVQPKTEEIALNMEAGQAKALFDPKASQAERDAALAAWEAEHRKKFAGKRRGKNNPTNGFGEEIDSFVFTGEDGQELEPLADWEIEEQVMSPRVYRKQLECFTQFAGGRNVDGKINFVIGQNGITKNFSSSLKGELGECLISSLSSIKFRPFGGTVKRVSVPVSYGR